METSSQESILRTIEEELESMEAAEKAIVYQGLKVARTGDNVYDYRYEIKTDRGDLKYFSLWELKDVRTLLDLAIVEAMQDYTEVEFTDDQIVAALKEAKSPMGMILPSEDNITVARGIVCCAYSHSVKTVDHVRQAIEQNATLFDVL